MTTDTSTTDASVTTSELARQALARHVTLGSGRASVMSAALQSAMAAAEPGLPLEPKWVREGASQSFLGVSAHSGQITLDGWRYVHCDLTDELVRIDIVDRLLGNAGAGAAIADGLEASPSQ